MSVSCSDHELLRRGGLGQRPHLQRDLVVVARRDRPERGLAVLRLVPDGELLRRGGLSGNVLTYNGSSWSSPVNIDAGTGCTPSPARRRASAPRWTATATSSPTTAARGRHPRASTRGVGTVLVSCPTASFCAAVDYTATPSPTTAARGRRPTASTRRRTCLRLVPDGELLRRGGLRAATSSPTTAARGRRPTASTRGTSLISVSCPTASFCAAVDETATSSPTTAVRGRRPTSIDARSGL